MKKICLFLAGFYISALGLFAQKPDTVQYKPRKLSLTEINFVSSYYHQEGNNSAITGGTGTEKLSDYSNSFEVKLLKYNKRDRKVELDANLGIDYYTSASSDKIDPYTISSASARDLRVYPSLKRTVTNEKGNTVSGIVSYSHESDYRSYGLGAGITRLSKDKNREFSAKAQLYADWLKLILPVEMRTASTGGLYGEPNYHDYPWRSRTTFNLGLSVTQVVNQRLQWMLLFDPTIQKGYLGLPFHRIYFKNFTMSNERLPSSRFKIPIGLRANYFAGDKLVVKSFYRFYTDDWKLTAHTAEAELAYKASPKLTLSPFYRFYTQQGTRYFAGYRQHNAGEEFYSSNFDLSTFKSHFIGLGAKVGLPSGVFGMNKIKMIELRYGYYKRTNGLQSHIVSIRLQYKRK